MQPPFPDWTAVIRACGPELPAWIRHRVREIGPSARVQLAQHLRAADPANDPEESADFSTQHVLTLLEEFEPDDAVVRQCLELIHAKPRSPLAFDVVGLLVRYGAGVAPAVSEVYGRVADGDEAGHLIAVLAQCGARDEAIFATLSDALRRFPSATAESIGHYGDVRAIEPLTALIDAYKPPREDDEEVDLSVHRAVFGAEAALVMLAATLSSAQLRKVEQALESAGGDEPVEPFDAPPRPAPNAPCWCGSERKYKKCHMAADQEGDAAPS